MQDKVRFCSTLNPLSLPAYIQFTAEFTENIENTEIILDVIIALHSDICIR